MTFQLVQSYTFSWSFVVSYHTIHSVGDDGAVADTFTSFSVMFQLPSNELLFMDFMLDWFTNLSCLLVAYQSYVATFPAVIPEFNAFNCACVNAVSFTVY